MNVIIKRVALSAGLAIALGVAGVGGMYLGRMTVPEAPSAQPSPTSTPTPCNLRMIWDRTSETYDAVYEDSVNMSLTGDYGPVTNPSCSDGQIIRWRDARIATGKSADVCRPVISFTVDGLAYFSGCAVPTMVVSGEPR